MTTAGRSCRWGSVLPLGLLVSQKLLPTVSSPPAIESPNKDYSEATAVRAYRSPRLLQNC